MPAFRIEWDAIKQDTQGNGFDVNQPFLFVLPHGGRHLLMSIIDRLKWRATYRTSEYDYLDWDDLLAMVELTHLGLMEGEPVGEIADSIIYLADKLADNFPSFPVADGESEMVTVTQTVNCGGCGGDVTNTSGGANLAPPDLEPVVPEDYAGSGSGSGLYQSDAQKCNMANYIIYSIRLVLLQSVEFELDYPSYNSLLHGLWDGVKDWVAGTLQSISYEGFAWIMNAVNGDASNTDRITDVFDQHFNYYVCELFNSVSEQDAYQRLYIAFDSTIPDFSVKSSAIEIASRMPFQVLFADDGDITIPAGFDGRECCGGVPDGGSDDVILPDTPAGYRFVEARYLSSVASEGGERATVENGRILVDLGYYGENVWGEDVKVSYDIDRLDLQTATHVGMIFEFYNVQASTDRKITIKDDQAWGSTAYGSGTGSPATIIPQQSSTYRRSVRYAFGHDELGAILSAEGDVILDNVGRNGAYTKFENLHDGSNTGITGSVLYRAWHILQDA